MDDTQLLWMLGLYLVACCWFLAMCCWLTLQDYPYSFVCNGIFTACCWFILRDAIKEAETPLAVQCSQVMEKMFETPEQRRAFYVSGYDGVKEYNLRSITETIVSNCSFFESLSVIPVATVADQSLALAFALNASMTEESREWWQKPEHRNFISYRMMQVILSSYRPNLIRGRSTGSKQWYYPSEKETIWSLQRYRDTIDDGSWFNATKKVLAEILDAEAVRYAAEDTTEPVDDITSLTAEIQVRMLREEAMRVYFQEEQRAMKGHAMNGI